MIWKMKVLLRFTITAIFKRFPKLISDENLVKLQYLVIFWRLPNLKKPRRFSEYICNLKLKDEKFDFWCYTDKFEVRKYVMSKIGSSYLIPLIGIYKCFDEIRFSNLPDKFVLKATHGSSFNIIVKDKKDFDIADARRKFSRWQSQNFFYKDREKNYFKIEPRVLCEEYLMTNNGNIEEFKLFCFNGEVKIIQQNTFVNKKRRSNIYDENWNLLPVKYGYPPCSKVELPLGKEELLLLAEKLSEDFDFVRVDLFYNDNKIFFSELTFHSGGGYIPFYPDLYDLKFGGFFNATTK